MIRLIVATVSLWLAMKLTKDDGSFLGLLTAAFTAQLFAFIPYAGGLLSFIVLLVLISRWTTAEIWPDTALIVVVAWCLTVLAGFAFSMAFR